MDNKQSEIFWEAGQFFYIQWKYSLFFNSSIHKAMYNSLKKSGPKICCISVRLNYKSQRMLEKTFINRLPFILKLAKIDNVLPFTERPSAEKTDEQETACLDAFGLFSLFTADIIKEDVIFTR